MNVNEYEEILKKATEHMVQSINSFGLGETLKLLVKFSNQDAIVRELLTIFPSLVTLNLFLQGKPVYKIQMNEHELERLLDTKFPFLIREENSRLPFLIGKNIFYSVGKHFMLFITYPIYPLCDEIIYEK